jgi:DNA-binding MarR family transcriptional regulator
VKDQFTATGIALDNALAFWIQRVQQASRTMMYRRFNALGVELTPEQWMVLVRLSVEPELTQSALSEATLRDKPTMSRIVEGMESRGLVRRRPDPTDARGRLVSLTPEAQRLRQKLMPAVRTMVDELEAGVPERDLEITRRTLQRLFSNLEARLSGE